MKKLMMNIISNMEKKVGHRITESVLMDANVLAAADRMERDLRIR